MVRKKRKGMKERGKAIDKLRRMQWFAQTNTFGFMLVSDSFRRIVERDHSGLFAYFLDYS